jgi:hypothetical protein
VLLYLKLAPRSVASLPGSTNYLVGPGVRNFASMSVAVETHDIPPSESSSQVRVLEQL